MNEPSERVSGPQPPPGGLRWPQITAIVLLTVVATALLTVWLIRVYVFPPQFEPVVLSKQEEQVLQAKIERLEVIAPGPAGEGTLTPEPYSEDAAARTVTFTERELNAMLAKNTEMADRVAIDLSDKLVSAKILVPLDEDFPLFGGRILRVKTGLAFDYQDGRPMMKLMGVTLMGVPLPGAWLGGLKNVDLITEFGQEPGFWKSFADGVADIEVQEGALRLRLRE